MWQTTTCNQEQTGTYSNQAYCIPYAAAEFAAVCRWRVTDNLVLYYIPKFISLENNNYSELPDTQQ
jgi:hypothetical protein